MHKTRADFEMIVARWRDQGERVEMNVVRAGKYTSEDFASAKLVAAVSVGMPEAVRYLGGELACEAVQSQGHLSSSVWGGEIEMAVMITRALDDQDVQPAQAVAS
jgi:hypothetical protein